MLTVEYSRVTGGDDERERVGVSVIRLKDVAQGRVFTRIGGISLQHQTLKSATYIKVLNMLLEHAPRPNYGVEAGDETVFGTRLREYASRQKGGMAGTAGEATR